jgi:DNA-binding NarL/FixJ family response regulator
MNGQMKPSLRKRKKTELMVMESPLGSLGLTSRETEVLIWIAQGKTNYEIGVILSACTETICKHVEHILCKLEVKTVPRRLPLHLRHSLRQKFKPTGAMMWLFLVVSGARASDRRN